MPRCCVPAAYPGRLLPQTTPGQGLVGHPHTQPPHPGRVGDMMTTGACNVHAHVHTKIASQWQFCQCRTTNIATKYPSEMKYLKHDLWETLALFARSTSKSKSSTDQGVSGHDVSKCLSSNTLVIQVNAGGQFHCLKLGRYLNNFLNQVYIHLKFQAVALL